MSLFETDIQSFIIKVWFEDARKGGGLVTWRGQITHVPSGARKSVQTLDEIAAFILPYLERMGVRIDGRSRYKLWWSRWMARMGKMTRMRGR
ncbi:MAG TPA: hypothetical protein VJ183_01605 [Chloroflexia bacterium]|nr:hypothetical protein [Chloroflexia bacterium]